MLFQFLSRPAHIIAIALTACCISPAIAQSGSRSPVQSPTRSTYAPAYAPTYTPRLNTQPRTVQNPATQSISKGVAIVELFTSQGCSSCPPADSVLRQIDEIAKKGKHDVHVLSFHVDYWNRLGWDDPYSSEKYSQRQRSYASARNSQRVYTPQMIVNGTNEFLGSDRRKALSAVSSSLKKGSVTQVQISRPTANQKTIEIPYRVAGRFQNSILNLAIVKTPEPTSVSRGENSGRTLAHVNVVRAFKTVPLTRSSGKVQLELPEGFVVPGSMIVAYAQNTRTLEITGATTRKL